MAATRIRVGVIGVGRMGERHCRIYANLSNVEFVGVSDLSVARGRTIADAYGVSFYEDFTDLLGRVDAVSVATPTDSHLTVAAECLRRHVHVLVEKPLASNQAEAREVLSVASRSAALLQVGHVERFNPVFLELQSIVEDLQIVALAARRLSPFDTSNTDVDVVFDLMIHDIDIALALLGDDISQVQAIGRSARTTAVDYAVANVAFADGPLATLTASRVTEQKVRLLEITTPEAYIEADLLNKCISIYRRTYPEYLSNHQRPLRYRQANLLERVDISTAEPLMLELQDFARCVCEGAKPKVSAEDGLRALELAARVREQMVPSPGGYRTHRSQ